MRFSLNVATTDADAAEVTGGTTKPGQFVPSPVQITTSAHSRE
ncbi:hypothetical protein U9R62_07850 [Cylindrospermopsis raciborskii DSH]